MPKLMAHKEFTSPVNKEYSMLPYSIPLGEHKSTLDLYDMEVEGSTYLLCEWDIPEVEEFASIGLWFDDKKEMTDYDGVFELPEQVIGLLEEQGFVVGEEFRTE